MGLKFTMNLTEVDTYRQCHFFLQMLLLLAKLKELQGMTIIFQFQLRTIIIPLSQQ